MSDKLEALRKPILPERVRCIGGDGFSFLPHRFLRDGFITALDRGELALYVFLVLAGNRDGVSFYRYDAICSSLTMSLDHFIEARNALIAKDLVAFDGSRFQVLSLPACPCPRDPRPLTSEADFEARDPASIRASLLAALKSDE